jgi:hypothetical protein
MVILRATLILGGQKEDKGMMCSITPCSVTTASYIRIKFSFKLAFNLVYKNVSKKYMFN